MTASTVPMRIFYCVYCGQCHTNAPATDEHIVPYAIGGSDALVIRDVCKDGNSTMGHRADGDLVNSLPMVLARHQRKIASERGRIPSFDLHGAITGGDACSRTGHLRISPDGKTETRLHPKVEWSEDGTTVHIECGEDDVERIIADVNAKQEARGLKPISVGHQRRVSIFQPTISGTFSIDQRCMRAAFVKMALAMGHHVFGFDWSMGEPADLLRKYLAATEKEREYITIRGSVWPATLGKSEGLTQIIRVSDNDHVLTVLQTRGQLLFHALLFGAYDGVIDLGANTVGWGEGDGLVTTINSLDRKVTRRTMMEHVAMFAPANLRKQLPME